MKWILIWWCFGIRSEWRRSAGFDKVAAVYNACRAQYGIFQSSDRRLVSRLGGQRKGSESADYEITVWTNSDAVFCAVFGRLAQG